MRDLGFRIGLLKGFDGFLSGSETTKCAGISRKPESAILLNYGICLKP